MPNPVIYLLSPASDTRFRVNEPVLIQFFLPPSPANPANVTVSVFDEFDHQFVIRDFPAMLSLLAYFERMHFRRYATGTTYFEAIRGFPTVGYHNLLFQTVNPTNPLEQDVQRIPVEVVYK